MKKLDDASVFIIMHQLLHLSKYQAMKGMEDVGLKPSQAGVLFVLNCEGKLSQRELAEKIGITPPSMTVALRKLEDQGYIVKEPDKEDQRIIRILLSDKGKECIEELKGIMESMEELLFQGISPEEKMFFRRLILEMRKNLLKSKDFKDMDMRTIIEKTGSPMKHNF
ncbi:MarR family winged helix-turn-helix transcriptional regulator [Bariatricus sp. SGI.154]|uniref:MarR family winged helix-turn-helix transcriptional regulator n=1 Tax=Bariatricus sp. SGI.154 TaxID=3420549 RepID=UPI003CFC5226